MVADNGRQTILHRYGFGILRVFFGGKFCLKFFFAVVAPIFIADSAVNAQSSSKEYQVKAAFLFNFAQFVEWPSNAFATPEAPFRIGILGDDPFSGGLDQLVSGETIQTHKLMIERSKRVEELQGCQMIFISKSEKPRMDEILSKLKGRQMLMVSEVPGFAGHGGMINFYLEGSKVRFEINLTAAQRAGLRMSSQLLSLGKIVESEPPNRGK